MAVAEREHAAVEVVDLETTSLRELNQRLHDLAAGAGPRHWRVVNPSGAHAVACGLDADVEVEIDDLDAGRLRGRAHTLARSQA